MTQIITKKFIGILIFLVILMFSGFYFGSELKILFVLFYEYPLLFVLTVFISEILFLPRLTGLLASGLLYPPLSGALYTVTGDFAAAAFIWMLGKHGLSEVSEFFINHDKAEKIKNLLDKAKDHPVFVITLLRIAPFAHYSATSLITGASSFPLSGFLLGTLFGIIPTAVIYSYLVKTATTGYFFYLLIFLIILTGFVYTLILKLSKKQ